MIIDIYTHLAPRSFLDRMVVLAPKLGNIVNRLLAVKPLSDLDVRFRDMDTVPDYRQLISLPNPSLEEIGPYLSKIDHPVHPKSKCNELIFSIWLLL